MMFNSMQIAGSALLPTAPAAQLTPLTFTIASQSFDAYAAGKLRHIIHDLADGDHDVILDMRHVEFMDSAGLGFLKALLQSLNLQGQKLQLIRLQIQPKQVLAMVRLSHLANTE